MHSVLSLPLIACLFGVLAAYGQLKGRVEQSDTPPITEIYKSQDPTKGRPQVLGAASGPNGRECIAPKRGNWVLVTRIGDTCYWFEPHVVYDPGYVVPIGDIRRVPGKCGGHPWDKRFAICEAPAGPVVDDPYANDKPGPCEISGSLSGPEYRRILYSAEYRKRCVFAGGYDPENNPGRAGVGPPNQSGTPSNPRQSPQQPPQPPLTASADYARGVAEGVGECVKGFGDLFAGAGYALQGDFVNAATMWGVEPGQSVFLRTVWQEAQAPSVGAGVTPNESGKIAGRRLCGYVIGPSVAKAAGRFVGKIRTQGATPLRPIPGKLVMEGALAEGSAKLLSDQWIETASGPLKLGKFLGKGKYGAVFEGSNPSRVVKVANSTPESAPSFERQRIGSERLRRAGIPTPRIHQTSSGSANHPAVLVMDNALKEWPGAFTVPDGWLNGLSQKMKVDIFRSIEEAGGDIAKAGLVWADGHIGNAAFVPKPGGGLAAIVVDADFVVPFQELTNAARLTETAAGSMVSTVLFSGGLGELVAVRPTTAAGWMKGLYQARFGTPLQPSGGGTGTLPRR